MISFRFEVGQKVKDKVTGFKGVIVCRSQYITGCNRYSVQSQGLNKDGKPADWVAFDEDQLLEDGGNINMKVKNLGGPPRFEVEQK